MPAIRMMQPAVCGSCGSKLALSRLGVEDVEQAAGDPAVQGADRRLVLDDRFGVGTVVQADGQRRVVVRHRCVVGSRVLQARSRAVHGRCCGSVGASSRPICSAGRLDRPQAWSTGRERAAEPAREVVIAAGGRPPGRASGAIVQRSRGRPRGRCSVLRTSSPSRSRRSRWTRTPLGCRSSRSASSTVVAGRPSSPSRRNRCARVGWVSASSGSLVWPGGRASLHFTHSGFAKQWVGANVRRRVTWTFVWLMLLLKIPIGGLLWIVWWAIHQTDGQAANGEGDGGSKVHAHRTPRPRPPRPRRGAARGRRRLPRRGCVASPHRSAPSTVRPPRVPGEQADSSEPGRHAW